MINTDEQTPESSDNLKKYRVHEDSRQMEQCRHRKEYTDMIKRTLEKAFVINSRSNLKFMSIIIMTVIMKSWKYTHAPPSANSVAPGSTYLSIFKANCEQVHDNNGHATHKKGKSDEMEEINVKIRRRENRV